MPQAMPLTTKISQGAVKRVKQRLLAARFGDGYFQTAADGINSIYEEWDIQWVNISAADRATVTAALLAVGATDYLTWTPPNDVSEKKYQIMPDKTAQLYTEVQHNGAYFDISVSLVQIR